MKDKPHIKYFSQAFFPAHIGVAFSEEDYLTELKRLKVTEPGPFNDTAASVKYFTKESYITCIICFDPIKHKKMHRNMVASLLAHEAVHVSDVVFRHIGETHPGDETRAYFVQSVLQDVLYALDDFMKGKKK